MQAVASFAARPGRAASRFKAPTRPIRLARPASSRSPTKIYRRPLRIERTAAAAAEDNVAVDGEGADGEEISRTGAASEESASPECGQHQWAVDRGGPSEEAALQALATCALFNDAPDGAMGPSPMRGVVGRFVRTNVLSRGWSWRAPYTPVVPCRSRPLMYTLET